MELECMCKSSKEKLISAVPSAPRALTVKLSGISERETVSLSFKETFWLGLPD